MKRLHHLQKVLLSVDNFYIKNSHHFFSSQWKNNVSDSWWQNIIEAYDHILSFHKPVIYIYPVLKQVAKGSMREREMIWPHNNCRQGVGWQRPEPRLFWACGQWEKAGCTGKSTRNTWAQAWTHWSTSVVSFLWAATEGRTLRSPFWIYLIQTHLTHLPFLDSSIGLQSEAQDSMEYGMDKSPRWRDVFKGRTAEMERKQKTSLTSWNTSCPHCVCN